MNSPFLEDPGATSRQWLPELQDAFYCPKGPKSKKITKKRKTSPKMKTSLGRSLPVLASITQAANNIDQCHHHNSTNRNNIHRNANGNTRTAANCSAHTDSNPNTTGSSPVSPRGGGDGEIGGSSDHNRGTNLERLVSSAEAALMVVEDIVAGVEGGGEKY
jgi:hypothetical protein